MVFFKIEVLKTIYFQCFYDYTHFKFSQYLMNNILVHFDKQQKSRKYLKQCFSLLKYSINKYFSSNLERTIYSYFMKEMNYVKNSFLSVSSVLLQLNFTSQESHSYGRILLESNRKFNMIL